MPKIQCPHCKAVNQDVKTNDPCWQCGTVLSAPVSTHVAEVGSGTTGTKSAGETVTSTAPILKQNERNPAKERVPISQRPRTSTPDYRAIVIALAVIALLIAGVVFLVMHH